MCLEERNSNNQRTTKMAISSFLYGLFQNKEYLVLNGLQEVNALCYVGTKISKAAKNFSTNNFHTF